MTYGCGKSSRLFTVIERLGSQQFLDFLVDPNNNGYLGLSSG